MLRVLIYRRVNRVVLIGAGSAALLAGVGLASRGWSLPWEAALSSILLLVLCRRRRAVLALPAVICIGLVCGLWRGGIVKAQVDLYSLLAEQKVIVRGVVQQDYTYGNRRQLDFMLRDVTVAGRDLPGQVRVTTFDAVEPRQGDVVEVTAKAKPGFGNYQLGMYYAQVRVVQRGGSWLGELRHNFSAAIRSVVPEPQASLGLGFLLGIKSQLPDELNDQLKMVGLTHIVVASGYNLTILVRLARRMLAKWSKFQATTLAGLLMVGFVAITGLSPSMTRAALVTSLSLAAWYYGRVVHPVVLLLFAAALTAAWNPLFLWSDIGWYLSFLAFGGVMLLAPLMMRRIFGKRDAPQLAQIVIETLCAELAALPLAMFIFGSVSVLGLVANVLVTPLVPLAMLTTFTAGLASSLAPGLGSWLALPATLLLTYMTSAVEWLATASWARQQVGMGLVAMLGTYCLLVLVGTLLWHKLHYNYLSKSVVE